MRGQITVQEAQKKLQEAADFGELLRKIAANDPSITEFTWVSSQPFPHWVSSALWNNKTLKCITVNVTKQHTVRINILGMEWNKMSWFIIPFVERNTSLRQLSFYGIVYGCSTNGLDCPFDYQGLRSLLDAVKKSTIVELDLMGLENASSK